jgi:hypothetical protein
MGAMAMLMVLAMATVTPATAAEAGTCGKGQVWDADQGKCVPKPKSTGSNAG